MIGTLDTEADWLATAWCLASGVTSGHGQDSDAFLLGHRVGFLAGFLAGKERPQDRPYDAYQQWKKSVLGL